MFIIIFLKDNDEVRYRRSPKLVIDPKTCAKMFNVCDGGCTSTAVYLLLDCYSLFHDGRPGSEMCLLQNL